MVENEMDMPIQMPETKTTPMEILARREAVLLENRAADRAALISYLRRMASRCEEAAATMEEADPANDHTYDPHRVRSQMESIESRLRSLAETRVLIDEIRKLQDRMER